ncbi:uncharacterized protein BX664DRAFT_340943 [Halteromyces radiatus]|uniref:uncharacterized protein n=1 Tax=Halteromyces radiatus TaxID=101107 RepID=UPI0022209E0F|nr:uncharacterized protein BX664DRAFT_340943 [Halteromyces radiatus]KAI8081658.1 hypothetical protein BX664DRAFT_340943 [Halteromyces radiatus]
MAQANDDQSGDDAATMTQPNTAASVVSAPNIHPTSHSSNYNNENKDGNDARTSHSMGEERIHDYTLPFLVRTKTNQEKDQIRSEYHLQLQQRQQEGQPSLSRLPTGGSLQKWEKRPIIGWIIRGYRKLSTSILLENKASVARDHLANERTFLAWLRTSLALITVGVAITQLYHLNPSPSSNDITGRALGGTFVALSIVFLYFANARYFHAQFALTQGQFPASRGAVLLGSICVLAVLLAMFIVIVTERR